MIRREVVEIHIKDWVGVKTSRFARHQFTLYWKWADENKYGYPSRIAIRVSANGGHDFLRYYKIGGMHTPRWALCK